MDDTSSDPSIPQRDMLQEVSFGGAKSVSSIEFIDDEVLADLDLDWFLSNDCVGKRDDALVPVTHGPMDMAIYSDDGRGDRLLGGNKPTTSVAPMDIDVMLTEDELLEQYIYPLIQAILQKTARPFDFMFIEGGPGSGKSHFLIELCRVIQQRIGSEQAQLLAVRASVAQLIGGRTLAKALDTMFMSEAFCGRSVTRSSAHNKGLLLKVALIDEAPELSGSSFDVRFGL